jgi:glycine/D-amino acid oxidase-like deaminating enzyme
MKKPLLVVGQGLAGTLLAEAFRAVNIPVHMMDAGDNGAASLVAAGIINPVTGKRYAMSWMYDVFFPIARETYLAIEKSLDIKIWQDKTVLKLLDDIGEYNNWVSKSGHEEYQTMMGIAQTAGKWEPYIGKDFRYGLLSGAAQVNLPLLLTAWRAKSIEEHTMFLQKVTHNEAEKLLNDYQAIVFCEGYKGIDNPFFPHLPWKPAKGEVLHIELEGNSLSIDEFPLLKHHLMVAPLADNRFWVGANYDWAFTDPLPTVPMLDYLTAELQLFMCAPYKVHAHKAGIRAATANRRPLLVRSTVHDKMFMFNGLGAKGTLLAPYWSKEMVKLVNGAIGLI